MASKEGPDTLDSVTHTIMKWYEQTHTTMTIAIKPGSPLDVELMGILLAARAQTLGALGTLANGHILSAHALLRILLETHVLSLWVLVGRSRKNKGEADEDWQTGKRYLDMTVENDTPVLQQKRIYRKNVA
ncbi:MAG: hypothetical protein JW720_13800 [Sedimentisphaerales bacterium]|nr:hypothetical protein [Sedimentisphaerales bacterium]